MASHFVSGGTLEKPTERDSEWLQAQQEIEDTRRRKVQDEKGQQDGKSLYEVLQQNKLAKQEAFEESIKLRNQFRALNDEEVDFLENTIQAERAKEDALRKETGEQLERFRKRQQQVDRVVDGDLDVAAGNAEAQAHSEGGINWGANAKKRKREKEKEGFKGVKINRTLSANEQKSESANAVPEMPTEASGHAAVPAEINARNRALTIPNETVTSKAKFSNGPQCKETPVSATRAAIPLVGYGSEEDSD